MVGNIEDKIVNSEIRDMVVRQYTDCTKLLNELLSLAPDQCYHEDSLGCCNFPTASAELGVEGLAYSTWKILRNARLAEEGLKLKDLSEPPCSYHKADVGCILGNLKSPVCMAVYCTGELDELGYDKRYVHNTLSKIMKGGGDRETRTWHPERNEGLVEEFKTYVLSLIEQVRSRHNLISEPTP